ncbi:decaprenyl-phosphate phosphoribosyltransferase [Quadrisphaera granulorum]|uniref:Decaprenyl-phosphate phosphoribosyltransferase n=1 Tax=Quadrisphaera granulorum TaxID=317664 RepID=A0A316A6A7_9ACTN|nr:decaprenyl-phosphate phosphoribosyltransferase [Quadrisphaera granulorum]PWJ53049.1 decaprenyl-phosphate phosphoribosyltransferase [Quadrisphaera granulorum]SZE97214.1 decaprenyl-phosphate phosphoribosyltransferase [Quadrisphaera granulorum]
MSSGQRLSAQTPVRRTPQGAALGVLRTMRPRQWVKNVLVGAAPLAAGLVTDVDVIRTTAFAFVSFCLAASAVYLLNDTLDVEADRAHPTKRNRPIAAGVVPVPAAAASAVVLAVASLGVAALATTELVVLMGVYLAVQVAYCVRLKHEPVLDIAIVASGFLLRAIAGGVASGITLSQWFLLVTAFGSLFMVAGKRYSEMKLAEAAGGTTRASLLRYSQSYLRFVWSLAASVMVTAYALWAFEIREGDASVVSAGGSTWSAISIVPFVLAVLRYAVDVDGGRAGAPEDIALRDRVLQVVALAWVATFALGVYT